MSGCEAGGCGWSTKQGRTYCDAHYKRLQVHGELMTDVPVRRKPKSDRCQRGHDLTLPDGLKPRPDGSNTCRECSREAQRRWHARSRGEPDPMPEPVRQRQPPGFRSYFAWRIET